MDEIFKRNSYNDEFKNVSRFINYDFMKDLKTGNLKPVLDAVKKDDTLLLQIRDNYINIYYRGCSVLKLAGDGNIPQNYAIDIDETYSPTSISNVNNWVVELAQIKSCVDNYLKGIEKGERESQQLIVRENSNSTVSNNTDYFIVDIEYAIDKARFDMLAIKWLSKSGDRRTGKDCSLAIIEMKYGDDALGNLNSHYTHVVNIVSKKSQALKDDAKAMFKQLRELDLIKFKKEGNKNDVYNLTDKIEYILLCANHKPISTKLSKKLKNIQTAINNNPDIDFRFATSSFMGYGLYNSCMLDYANFVKLLELEQNKKV